MSIRDSPVAPQALAGLLDQVERKTINANTGKGVLADMFRTGRSAQEIVAEQELAQISNADAIEALVVNAIESNPEPLAQYQNGKESVFGFFIGQVMRASRGKANPQIVRELLKARLDALQDEQAPD